MEEELARLKPDIMVIGAFGIRYNNVEWLSETLQFLRRIGVRQIIVLGDGPGGRNHHNRFYIRLCGQTLRVAYRIACLPFTRRVLKFDKGSDKIRSKSGRLVYLPA